ncbi:HalOD1 output domain-containing protein [Halosimplex marinum]|uniref:HalOD1 output domain-containing protein n=1 Tax=Halosimplex marinum TaxID=3396620 RepID=UPI003F578AAA
MSGPAKSRLSVQRQYDCSETSPSLAVVHTLADIKNCDPANLVDPQLSEYIDPDAVDRLVRGNEDVQVSFSIDRYRVCLAGTELTIRLHRS